MRSRILGRFLWHYGLPAVLLAGVAGGCAAQSSALGLSSGKLPAFSDDPAIEARIRTRQIYVAQEKRMVEDSNKLVQLATKLNAEVASQHGQPLTPAEQREVAEIEKLAHSVRTKMQDPVPSTLFQPNSPNPLYSEH